MRNKNKENHGYIYNEQLKMIFVNCSKSFTRLMKNSGTRKLGSTWTEGKQTSFNNKTIVFLFWLNIGKKAFLKKKVKGNKK